LEGRAPWSHPPGYALVQYLKKRFLTEKNQASYTDFAQSCRNYIGNRKNLDYYWLFSQVLLHPKLGS